jgi:CRISPR-associated protein (TIGR02584 family)
MKRESLKADIASAGGIRHRFVFVLGGSPQVVTETLWWWFCRHDPPIAAADLQIITTTEGAAMARRHLIGPSGRLARFVADYGLTAPTVGLTILKDRRGRPLVDIRTTSENEAVSAALLKIVTRLTADPGVICHFSVAGGRKTLGLHLAMAIMFRAREHDTLSHILAPADKENNLAAFYPRPGENWSGLDLAFLPLLRLRPYAQTSNSLRDHVASFQTQLERGSIVPRVVVAFEASELRVGDLALRLPRQQLALWCTYALVSETGLDLPGLIASFDAFISYLHAAGASSGGAELTEAWRECAKGPGLRHAELDERLLQLRAKLVRRLRNAFADPLHDYHINVRPMNGPGIPRRYGVRIGRSRILLENGGN